MFDCVQLEKSLGEFDFVWLPNPIEINQTIGVQLSLITERSIDYRYVGNKLRGVSSWLNSWERETREALCRREAVQGPQGISSSKNISSVNIITESLQSLKETIEYVNSGCLTQHRLVSLPTLVVEHLFSKIRPRNPIPTVLEYVYLFVPTMK